MPWKIKTNKKIGSNMIVGDLLKEIAILTSSNLKIPKDKKLSGTPLPIFLEKLLKELSESIFVMDLLLNTDSSTIHILVLIFLRKNNILKLNLKLIKSAKRNKLSKDLFFQNKMPSKCFRKTHLRFL